ncbi:MAG: DNA repair protein RecO [Candidatus Paceibacterota bacterium]|jgi:DNA repair protein RecO (recombination protein O)
MSTYKSEGIIIKRHNFGESSLILDFYTKEYGKVEAVARSARKHRGKLKGHLELFLCTDLIFAHARSIDKTTSSFTLKSFSCLRKNFRAASIAYYFSELVEKMTIAGHRDERIYHLLKDSLVFLDESADISAQENSAGSRQRSAGRMDTLDLLVLFFQINILDLAGYSAEFRRCVHCLENLNPGENYFSHSLGGIVCDKCTSRDNQAVFLDDNAVKLMRFLQYRGGSGSVEHSAHLSGSMKNLKKICAEAKMAGMLNHLMNTFIEFNIERKIRSIDFIRIM